MKHLILVTSPPACGKTHVTRQLAKALTNCVYLDKDTLSRVNVLKHFAYVSLIDSSRLKVAESRGYEIIEKMS